MELIKNKMNYFNNVFTKEEKMVVIVGSLVTIMSIVCVWWLVISILLDLTGDILFGALNKLVGILFEGWSLY